MVRRVPGVLVLAVLQASLFGTTIGSQTSQGGSLHTHRFSVPQPAEALVRIVVRCTECDWGTEGREAVVLRLTLDGRFAQQLPLVRGDGDYHVLVGALKPGAHTLAIEEEAALTPTRLRGRRAASVEAVSITQVTASSSSYEALALAPIVYARPDTVGRFTDVPVLMWYETEPTSRGTRYRYSVIFTNEDGGTPADRLMATWGRTTDIEYIYSVEVDARGRILSEDMQGPKHEILPFRGQREGRHPRLWVSTENNMVLDHGATTVRYAPAPIEFPLKNVSREAVMDANWWLYAVAAKELMREGKIVAEAAPAKGVIPDPRRFIYVEGCGELGNHALAFAVRVGSEWIASDRNGPDYRIARDGCFRAAMPLPAGAGGNDVRALRVQAFERPGKPGTAPVRFTRINTLFTLDDGHMPGPALLKWEGSAALNPGGPPLEIPIP